MTREPPIDPALEQGYNLRLHRNDVDDVIAGWTERSAAFRKGADCRLDLSYDEGPRQRLDVFFSGTPDAPLLAFIHGGYWQRGDKSIYSFLAEPFLARGIDVALIGYPLCPQVSVTDIVASIRTALAWLWRQAPSLGLSQDRLHLSGHSAGGQLTAMALTTPWPELASELPADLIKTAVPISGIFDVAPLRHTSIGDALSLSAQEARDNSPSLLRPVGAAPLLVVLGNGETPAFHGQADHLITQWQGLGASMEKWAEPEVDHFDVLNRLAAADSALFKKVAAQVQTVSA